MEYSQLPALKVCVQTHAAVFVTNCVSFPPLRTRGEACVCALVMCVSVQETWARCSLTFTAFPLKGCFLSQGSSGCEGNLAWQACLPGRTEEGWMGCSKLTGPVSFRRHPGWRSRTAPRRATTTTLPMTLSRMTQCMCRREPGAVGRGRGAVITDATAWATFTPCSADHHGLKLLGFPGVVDCLSSALTSPAQCRPFAPVPAYCTLLFLKESAAWGGCWPSPPDFPPSLSFVLSPAALTPARTK